MKIKLLFVLLFVGINTVFASYEESFKQLTTTEQAIVDKANEYFDNMTTLKTNFIQYDNATENMAEGMFYIQKPKKMRFEYTHPFNNLLIVNGKVTTFYDKDLDEISNFTTKSLPISFLIENNSNLRSVNSTINKVSQNNNEVIISTLLEINDSSYNIDYTFNKELTVLQTINFKEKDGQDISLSLFNSEINTVLDKNLFIFKNPRLYKNRK